MVVSVEISGILEERLRRLVDLGIYATVAEAVRDAVREFLKNLDLKEIALELYLKRGATFQYTVEFAGETYESMMDYFISKGVLPLVGALREEDLALLGPGEYVLDGVTLYVAYKSGLVEVMKRLRGEGYRFLAPRQLEVLSEVLEARRILEGLKRVEVVEFVAGKPVRLGDLVTPVEASAIGYASSRGIVLLSDDARTRELARDRGVRAYSSASLIATLMVLDEDEALEYASAYRSVPALLPDEALRAAALTGQHRLRGELASGDRV